MDYRAPHKEKASSYVVNPLGLVQADSVLYVIVRIERLRRCAALALHRMSKPERLDTPARPKGFDFDKHVREEKQFEYPVGDPIAGTGHGARCSRNLAERRLSTDQVITPLPGDEGVRITATVANTELKEHRLRSLGPNVEIVKPASLRRRDA